MNIVILERDSVGTDISVDCYKDFGDVTFYANTDNEADVIERIKDADIVINNKAPMNARTLANATNVRLIAGFATGFDNVDIPYCQTHDIAVANVSNYCTEAVAQHTFAMALFLLEKLSHYDNYVKSGEYQSQRRFSNFDIPFTELAGKTWGIVGMGNIGHAVAKIATAFGCKVIFYSASGHSTCTDYPQVDLDTLLQTSDFVSLHCPLTDRTRNLIDAKALKKMKPTALLINVARGPVVNNHDLYDALVAHTIAGAGLDVLEKEPLRAQNPLSTFKDSTRLIITPHLAWASTEARQRCVDEVYENIKAFLEGKKRNIVS